MTTILTSTLKDLGASKKFLFVLLTTIAILAFAKLGTIPNEEAHKMLLVLWPTYLLSQGVADIGSRLGTHAARTLGEPLAALAKRAAEGASAEELAEAAKELTEHELDLLDLGAATEKWLDSLDPATCDKISAVLSEKEQSAFRALLEEAAGLNDNEPAKEEKPS